MTRSTRATTATRTSTRTPGETPVIGIVGAGAVGTALGVALSRAGWPVHAIASRDPARRDAGPGASSAASRAFAEAQALVEEVELIIVAIPDDALAAFAAQTRMYSGQAMVHTSGALDADVLAPAMAAGTQIGAFHPLVAFADTERAVADLHGATIAIEADDQLADLLARMAEAIGGRPVRLVPGSKAAYHAAAVLAAGGLVALLDAIVELGRVAGLDEAGAMAIYGPLIDGTLANARALGRGRRPDRTDHPRRHRDAAAITWPRCAPMPRTRWTCTAPRRNGRSRSPRAVARWHRSVRPPFDPPLQARTDGVPLPPMQHSIAAKYAARPAARFVRPSSRTRERRLGLRPSGSLQPAAARATVLRRPDVAPLTHLRAGWRAITAGHGRRLDRCGPAAARR